MYFDFVEQKKKKKILKKRDEILNYASFRSFTYFNRLIIHHK